MMKLLAAGPSPFVRKVRLAAMMKGVGDQVRVVSTDDPDHEALRARNPLAKIPVLLTDDGETIYDSHVICEYLDSRSVAPVLFPHDGPDRWRALTLAALADGILDAAILIVYEGRHRPEDMRVQTWVDMQQAKIDTALGVLESAPPAWTSYPHYGHLTVAAALGYLDFRQNGAWRAGNPGLVAWLARFAEAVPAFEQTAPEG